MIFWAPTYLERQARLLQAAPEIEFSFGNFFYQRDDVLDPRDKFSQAPKGYWDITPRRLLPEGWLFEGSIAAQTIVDFHPIFPSAVLLSRALIHSVGAFDTAMRGLSPEDGEFILRCLYRARTAALPEPLVTIRRHDANSSRDQLKVVVDEIRILQFIRKNHAEAQTLHDIIDRSIAKRRIDAIERAFDQGNHRLARHLFSEVPWTAGRTKLRLKRLVVALPDTLGLRLNALLQRFGSASAHRPRLH
jgi:hypothetical protein